MNVPTDYLFNLLQPSRLTSVVDIGANPIDGNPPYLPMLKDGLCTVIGFEPQQQAFEKLNAHKSLLETYLPYAIGNGEPHTLHVCRASGMTSLLKPDRRKLSLFHGFPQWGEIINEQRIETRRLDDISEIASLDFLKIDAQGSELAIFRGGRQKLADAVAIQTEVSFVPLYEGQPGFGEIDIELRSQGFLPHAFADINRRAIAPFLANSNLYAGLNQLLEADVVYARDFTNPDALTDEQLKHLALIVHHCYKSYDLTLYCLRELEKREVLAKRAHETYLEKLTEL